MFYSTFLHFVFLAKNNQSLEMNGRGTCPLATCTLSSKHLLMCIHIFQHFCVGSHRWRHYFNSVKLFFYHWCDDSLRRCPLVTVWQHHSRSIYPVWLYILSHYIGEEERDQEIDSDLIKLRRKSQKFKTVWKIIPDQEMTNEEEFSDGEELRLLSDSGWPQDVQNVPYPYCWHQILTESIKNIVITLPNLEEKQFHKEVTQKNMEGKEWQNELLNTSLNNQLNVSLINYNRNLLIQ